MMPKLNILVSLLVLITLISGLLSACGPDLTVTPVPTSTSIDITAPGFTQTPLPAATDTPGSTIQNLPLATSITTPAPHPDWKTYTNEFLGYRIHYPADGTINEGGFGGMNSDEVIPPGFDNFDEYFDYSEQVMPDGICVSVSIPGFDITIAPPMPFRNYIGPCPGMGIGTGYRWEKEHKTFLVTGQEIDIPGTQLYWESSGAFDFEFYYTDLDNGFRVSIVGSMQDGMDQEAYQEQWATGLEMLATLHWIRTPDLTRPGTTCAGKNTRLMPGVEAMVLKSTGIYTEPDLSSENIAEIPQNTVVLVRAGPACTDEAVFWQVESQSIPGGIGWVTEGDWTDYWLERYRVDGN